MASDESDQEYEEIALEMTNGKHAVRNKKWSPIKRPGLPLPTVPGSVPGGITRVNSTPYDSSTLPGLRKTASVDSEMTQYHPPPLPPPNKPVGRSASLKHPLGIRPPAPLPPSKPDSGPPAVPPKPGLKSDVTSPVGRKRLSDNFIIENEELNPENFLSKYRDSLPLHVRVSKGFYGNSDKTSVSEGDSFNIHFIKNTKVLCMEDGGGGEFKIALNSGIEFGILYDPNDKRDEAVTGHTFEKVSDLQQVKTLPKVLRTGCAWQGSSSESTITKNELLIVKGWKRKISSKNLKVYSIATKEKKELPENCIGKFTTRSYDIRLFLSDIMEHVVHPLPCKAICYVNSDTCGDVDSLSNLSSTILSLKALTTETTLIATNAFVDDYDEKQAIEIPFDLDIDFQVMRPKAEKETEDLYVSTRKLLENFTKLKMSSTYISSSSESAYATQSALYSIVREGKEWTGIDVVKPPAIYMNTSKVKSPSKSIAASSSKTRPNSTSSSKPPPLPPVPTTPSNVPGPQASPSPFTPRNADVIYDEFDTESEAFVGMNKRLESVEKEVAQLSGKIDSLGSGAGSTEEAGKISREITAARADMKRMETRGTKAAEDAAKAKSDIAEMKPIVEHLRKLCEAMQREIGDLKEGLSQSANSASGLPNQQGYMTLAPLGSATGEEALMEENKKYVKRLNFNQVINLLEMMGLSQHQPAFTAERVDGEILLECDDAVLQQELKITSKLQRVRLLKIIQGRHSAEMILCGEDPYAYAQPK